MSDTTTLHSEDSVPVTPLASLQRLPKASAVRSFESRLVEIGIPAAMAGVLARGVVDPADARRRLDRLTPIRVPGGIVYALETTVWATALVPYLVNNREASARHFPAGVKIGTTEAALFLPLRPPIGAADGSACLAISATKPDHLVWSLERSAKFLLDHNDLTASIAEQGVMQHVTVAAIDAVFESGDQTVTMLGTLDGSSRINSAHANLGLTPNDVVFRLPRDPRSHRQFIAQILDKLDQPTTEVGMDELARLRSLEIPARIFVRFEPDPVTPVTYAKAVDSFVHLVHVEPPKPWDDAGSLDAKADSVLNELHNRGQITPVRKAYFEGMLSPDEASASKLSPHLDERALEIVAVVSSEKQAVHKAVRDGVLLISHRGSQVRRESKAQIAVELALRGVRSNLTKADAKGARETLKDVYLSHDIWGKHLKPTKQTPEELRDSALAELKAGGPGEACLRVAAQGAFWLAVQRVLREARFFDSDTNLRDGRTPARVLADLMSTGHGINVLYRAIVDGRDGVPIQRVDKTGAREKTPQNKILEAKHNWLRGEVAPQPGAGKPSGNGSAATSGPTNDRLLLNRLAELRKAVENLEEKHADLRGVTDANGNVFVDLDGIAQDTTEDLRVRLESVRTHLFMYGVAWTRRNAEPQAPADDDGDEES